MSPLDQGGDHLFSVGQIGRFRTGDVPGPHRPVGGDQAGDPVPAEVAAFGGFCGAGSLTHPTNVSVIVPTGVVVAVFTLPAFSAPTDRRSPCALR